jgi:hypothetical protein
MKKKSESTLINPQTQLLWEYDWDNSIEIKVRKKKIQRPTHTKINVEG